MKKVFISYAREDIEVAGKLLCFIAITVMMTVILFVFFPIKAKGENVCVHQKAVIGTEENQRHAGDGDRASAGVSGAEYRLRSEPLTLSEDDANAMLKKHNFFDKYRNSSGNFKNDFKDSGNGQRDRSGMGEVGIVRSYVFQCRTELYSET